MVTTQSKKTLYKGDKKQSPTKTSAFDRTDPRQLFVSSAISMSWQMAASFLVPILGSFYLGQYLKINWLVWIGFLIGIVLTVFVVKRTINELPQYGVDKKVRK